MTSTTPPKPHSGAPRYRRRNYLIDPRFQLKYTGLLVAVVLAVMLLLGVQIARSANVASSYAQLAATQAERAMKESHTSSKLARQNVLTNAGDNPILLQVMEEELAATDRQAEKDLEAVKLERVEVELHRREMRDQLIGAGIALTVLLTSMGIFITSKIVGPVYKIKRLLRRVGTGRLAIKERLRKGDELEDLFDTFLQMTYSLKALQSGRMATLEATMETARATNASPEVIEGLQALRAQMALGLGPSPLAARRES
jgi:nitrogen fixation/metabolism regulation signal transduction histidine kinase